MVEKDPALCEHLNGDIDVLCGWPNFRNKSCVSLCLFHLLSIAYVVFLSSLPMVSYFPLF
jgi:hypothetical protein